MSETFDYVIVGGGTAGCVLANRLSADPTVSVCLLEAGPPDKHWVLSVPSGVAAALNRKEYSWGYESTSQPGLGDRPFRIPRGRVLGGCSSVNGMVYFRGHPGDFDDWGSVASGWSYREVLPYFIRSECNFSYAESPYHGFDGEMAVTDPARPNPLVLNFLEATRSLGLKPCDDFNAADPEGFGLRQSTIRNGRRESMSRAFIRPVQNRSNLRVVTDVLVDRVVIKDRRAVGVEASLEGVKKTFEAKREVVLSAGAYGSPALLLRSGVGDATALSALGIPVHHHLPAVGRGLRDHPSAAIQMRTEDPTSYGISWKATPRNVLNVMEWLLWKRGPVGGNVFEATGFVKTDPSLPRPDLQLVFMPAHRNASTFPIPIGHGFGILSIAARPKSEGTVSLASSDPRTPPLINPNFFGHPDDLRTVREGLKLARTILQKPSFAKYSAVEIVPGIGAQSTHELDEHIRRTAVTVHHPGCTCRMGKDAEAVVDPELRVQGIDGLRVADASVFPTLVAGNTNAAVVMIAEKSADLILRRQAPAALDLPHAA